MREGFFPSLSNSNSFAVSREGGRGRGTVLQNGCFCLQGSAPHGLGTHRRHIPASPSPATGKEWRQALVKGLLPAHPGSSTQRSTATRENTGRGPFSVQGEAQSRFQGHPNGNRCFSSSEPGENLGGARAFCSASRSTQVSATSLATNKDDQHLRDHVDEEGLLLKFKLI